jgi:tetratricopeptide (TPR) repeat protein
VSLLSESLETRALLDAQAKYNSMESASSPVEQVKNSFITNRVVLITIGLMGVFVISQYIELRDVIDGTDAVGVDAVGGFDAIDIHINKTIDDVNVGSVDLVSRTGGVNDGTKLNQIRTSNPPLPTVMASSKVPLEPKPLISQNSNAPMYEYNDVALQSNLKTLPVLIALANEHVEAMRLTRPDGNNAYALIHQVLQIDSENSGAIDSLRRIQLRYLDLISSEKNQNRRNHYIASLRSIENNNAQHLDLTSIAPSAGPRSKVMVSVLNSKNQSTDDDPTNILSEEPSVSEDKTLKKMEIRTSRATSFERVRSRVDAFRRDGDFKSALHTLEDFLDSSNRSVNINKAAVNIEGYELYINLAYDAADSARLEQYDFRYSKLNDYARARYLQLNSRVDESVLYLEGVTESSRSNASQQLLAAMYQQAGNKIAAYKQYKKLLLVDPDNAKNLLGFSISADTMGYRREALSSFTQLRKMHAYNGQVAEYIQASVQRLSGQVNNKEALEW